MIYFQGHASPGIYARAYLEGRISEAQLHTFRQRTRRRRRAVVLSASIPDAVVLAVPDRLDGPRPDHVHLPGPVQPVPESPRVYLRRGAEDLGIHRRRRNATSRKRSAPSRSRRANRSTTSSGSSTAICSGLTGRSAATARSSRSWKRRSAARDGTSSRSSGAPTGIRCFAMDEKGLLLKRMEEAVDGDYQKYSVEPGSYTRKHFFGKVSGTGANGEQADRRADPENCGAAGTIPQKVYAAYKAAVEHKGAANGHPRQDGQGVRPRRSGGRPEHDAPAEED